jgi:hypothetical protein
MAAQACKSLGNVEIPTMPVTLGKTYDVRLDEKKRFTLRGATHTHYEVRAKSDGSFEVRPVKVVRHGSKEAGVFGLGVEKREIKKIPATKPGHPKRKAEPSISRRTLKGIAECIESVKAGRRGEPVYLAELAAMKV